MLNLAIAKLSIKYGSKGPIRFQHLAIDTITDRTGRRDFLLPIIPDFTKIIKSEKDKREEKNQKSRFLLVRNSQQQSAQFAIASQLNCKAQTKLRSPKLQEFRL